MSPHSTKPAETQETIAALFRYYRDRLSVPRGPCNISVLRECWVHGVIDDGTLVWGQGLIDWLPVKNVRTLVPQIRTLEGTCYIPLSKGAMQCMHAEALKCS